MKTFEETLSSAAEAWSTFAEQFGAAIIATLAANVKAYKEAADAEVVGE